MIYPFYLNIYANSTDQVGFHLKRYFVSYIDINLLYTQLCSKQTLKKNISKIKYISHVKAFEDLLFFIKLSD